MAVRPFCHSVSRADGPELHHIDLESRGGRTSCAETPLGDTSARHVEAGRGLERFERSASRPCCRQRRRNAKHGHRGPATSCPSRAPLARLRRSRGASQCQSHARCRRSRLDALPDADGPVQHCISLHQRRRPCVAVGAALLSSRPKPRTVVEAPECTPR